MLKTMPDFLFNPVESHIKFKLKFSKTHQNYHLKIQKYH